MEYASDSILSKTYSKGVFEPTKSPSPSNAASAFVVVVVLAQAARQSLSVST